MKRQWIPGILGMSGWDWNYLMKFDSKESAHEFALRWAIKMKSGTVDTKEV